MTATDQQSARVRQGVLLIVVGLVMLVGVLAGSVVWVVTNFHPVPAIFIGLVDAAAIYGGSLAVRLLIAVRKSRVDDSAPER